MARLLVTFMLYLVGVSVLGLLISSLIAASTGISMLGPAVAIIAQMLAAMWSGAVHARRTMVIPEAGFIWRASIGMIAIMGLLWGAITLTPILWGDLLGAALVDLVLTAWWVFAIAGVLVVAITLFGTRYVLTQSIRATIEEEHRKVRETF